MVCPEEPDADWHADTIGEPDLRHAIQCQEWSRPKAYRCAQRRLLNEVEGEHYGYAEPRRQARPGLAQASLWPDLQLNTAYQEQGIVITVTSLTRQINPASVPFDPADRPPSQHFVRIDVTLHNTTSQRWDVETRLRTTTSGGSLGGLVDLAPVVINGQQVYMKPANLDALNLIDAGQTVQRSVYYLINPDLTTMALYLNLWTPGQRNFTNLPQLCLVDVSAQ